MSTVDDTIQLLAGPVVQWRARASLTNPPIDHQFLHFAELTRDLDRFGWVWDVGTLQPPAPAALARFGEQASPFAGRTTHLALCTGSNIGLWLSLRHVLPEAGFRTISVHRSLSTAIERARRG